MTQDRPWDPRLAPLLKRTAEIRDLNAALAVLGWDQQVYMPSGAAAGRAASSLSGSKSIAAASRISAP